MAFGRHPWHPEPETLLLADEGLLSATHRAEVEAHLTSCQACLERQALLRQADRDLADLGRGRGDTGAPALHARARLEQVLATVQRGSSTPPRGHLAGRWWLRVASTIVVVGLIFASTDRSGERQGLHDDAEAVILPDRTLTPGLAGSVSTRELCADDPPAVGRVPASLRGVVLASYGLTHLASDEYELDYLITPELGGARDPRNLWPERYESGPWNARVKDELEALLPDLVCRGQLDLATAQHDIAANWVDAYKKYFGTDRPLRSYAGVPDGLSFPPRQPDR